MTRHADSEDGVPFNGGRIKIADRSRLDRVTVMTDPRYLVKKLLEVGPKYLTGFLNAVWNTLRNASKYLVGATAYVILVWLSQLLVVNPNSILIEAILGFVGLAVGIVIALKRKSWVRPYTSFLTWLAITMGSITAGQLSRITISLAQFVQSDWRVLIGVGTFVVLIAMAFWFVDIFRSGTFMVEASGKK